MSKLNVLLTGGSGFIGRHFLELFGHKYNITAPTREEADLLYQESVERFFKGKNFDIVIHGANIGGDRKSQGVADVTEKIVRMCSNLLSQKSHFGRMIFFGSGAEYAKQRPIVKVAENDFGKIIPEDSYGLGKFICSKLFQPLSGVVNLRCFGVYGKYEDYAARFISNAVCQSLAGKPITIRQNAVFSYIYVNDLVKIVDFFIEHEPQEKFYNVGNGQFFELLQLAEIVKNLTGARDIKVLNPGLNREYTCDSSLLQNELKGFNFTPMEKSIKEMVNWYRANWEKIDQSKLM